MLVGIRADTTRAAQAAEPEDAETPDLLLEQPWIEPIAYEEPVARTGLRRAFAVLLVGAAIAWVAALLWFGRGVLMTMSAIDLAQFGAALATVPALLGVLWLIGLRTSYAEARRFGATAAAMREEAARLEATVRAMGFAIDEHRPDFVPTLWTKRYHHGEASAPDRPFADVEQPRTDQVAHVLHEQQ